MLQCQQLKSVTWTACKRAIETYSFLFFALYFKGLNYGLAMSVIVFTVSVLMFCVASSYWSTVYCLLVYYSPPKSGGLQRKGRPQSIVYTCPLIRDPHSAHQAFTVFLRGNNLVLRIFICNCRKKYLITSWPYFGVKLGCVCLLISYFPFGDL